MPRTRSSVSIERLEGRTLLAAPFVITHGGTYSGTWESTDRTIPAVIIATADPVIIQNSTVRGPGTLIATHVDHTKITVRNTTGYGTNPNVYGKAKGRFFDAEIFDSVKLENNVLEGTGGILLLGYGGDHSHDQSIRIVGNRAHNIDGRRSDGKGGYLDFNTRISRLDGHVEDGWAYAQFLQMDKVRTVRGVKIAWNQVINDPGASRVEDNISIYNTNGAPGSPIRIHDNYIQGAYTIKPWQADTEDANWHYDWSYSGGGILLGDGRSSQASRDSAYVRAYGNTVVSTTNYGIAVAAGHNMDVYSNRIVSAGKLSDGRTIVKQNVGIYIWDSYGLGPSRFYNNTAHDNIVGWVQGTGRNDWWMPDARRPVNNQHWAGTITGAVETAERNLFNLKLLG